MALACWICSGAATASAQTWTLQTIEGETYQVPSLSIDAQGKLTAGGLTAALHLADLLSIQSDREQTAPAAGFTIVLVGGGQVRASAALWAGDQLTVQGSPWLQQLPIEAVRGLVWKSHHRLERALAQPLGDKDQVIVAAEEAPVVASGLLESVSESEVRIDYDNRSVGFPIGDVLGVVFADVSRPVDSSAVRVRVRTTCGDQIGGHLLQWQSDGVQLQLSSGQPLSLPTELVSRIEVESDRLRFISDLTPMDVEQRTWFAPSRPWQKDRSVTGGPLALRDPGSGQTRHFEKGLGTQAYTRLVFQNDGDYDRLRAVVGIDAATNGRGDCEMSVIGDGIVLWQAPIAASQAPQSLDVDIKGVRRLELIVEPGNQFDLSDHANWADARLLKTL